MHSALKSFFVKTASGRIVWHRASVLKGQLKDLLWEIEAPWVWRTGYKTLKAAPPPIFIGGTGGSGTRVVTGIVQSAGIFMGSSLYEANDARATPWYLHKWKAYVKANGTDFSVRQQQRMRRDLIFALLKHRGHQLDSRSPWGAKNPWLIYFLPHLHACFPDLKFIHVIRDGRDMAFSKNQFQLETVGEMYLTDLKTRLANAAKPVRSIALWSKINSETTHFGETILGDHYLRVRLEDLCAKPDLIIPEIYRFLETPEADVQSAVDLVSRPASLGRWIGRNATIAAQLHQEGRTGLQAFGYLET